MQFFFFPFFPFFLSIPMLGVSPCLVIIPSITTTWASMRLTWLRQVILSSFYSCQNIFGLHLPSLRRGYNKCVVEFVSCCLDETLNPTSPTKMDTNMGSWSSRSIRFNWYFIHLPETSLQHLRGWAWLLSYVHLSQWLQRLSKKWEIISCMSTASRWYNRYKNLLLSIALGKSRTLGLDIDRACRHRIILTIQHTTPSNQDILLTR